MEIVTTGIWQSRKRERREAQRIVALNELGFDALPSDTDNVAPWQRAALDAAADTLVSRGLWSKETPRDAVRDGIRKLVGRIRRQQRGVR